MLLLCRVIWKVTEKEDFADVHTESMCFLSLVRDPASCQGPYCPGTVWVKDLDGLRWTTGFLLPSVMFIIKVGSAEIHQGYLVRGPVWSRCVNKFPAHISGVPLGNGVVRIPLERIVCPTGSPSKTGVMPYLLHAAVATRNTLKSLNLWLGQQCMALQLCKVHLPLDLEDSINTHNSFQKWRPQGSLKATFHVQTSVGHWQDRCL